MSESPRGGFKILMHRALLGPLKLSPELCLTNAKYHSSVWVSLRIATTMKGSLILALES